MPIAELAPKAASWGYDGLELATWGDHLDVGRVLDEDGYAEGHLAMLRDHGLGVWAISCHLVGQAVADRFIDDDERNVEGARAVGLHGVHFTSPDDLRRHLAALDLPVSAG